MFENWIKACCFITRKCNLKCRGCNVINHQSTYELSTEKWLRVFDILKARNVGFTVLFGGEPTLNNDLPEMLKYLNTIGMPNTVITNSVRMMKDQEYYDRIIAAKPYGITTSVNVLKADDEFHDNIKSELGANLLYKIRKDYPECDLVANINVTRKNIYDLPKVVEHFTKLGIWSILTFYHVCPPEESMHWWYRGPVTDENKELVFRPGNREDLEALFTVSAWFIAEYNDLKLHNQLSYFAEWCKYGASQDWHCGEWVYPGINSDGSLMACVDKPLVRPYSIFDLENTDKDAEILKAYEETIAYCESGCFWDHVRESDRYVAEDTLELGKKKFSHRE
jgi:MoaA/NifB/PqqE/SkfB family radical SAM enzyme